MRPELMISSRSSCEIDCSAGRASPFGSDNCSTIALTSAGSSGFSLKPTTSKTTGTASASISRNTSSAETGGGQAREARPAARVR